MICYYLFRESLDRFDSTDLERKSWIEGDDDLFYTSLIISHLDKRRYEYHICSILLCIWTSMLREVDTPFEIYYDFLCCFFSDTWNR